MYRYSAYRRLAKVAGCPAAAPCQHHTVPKRVGKTTLEQRRPRLERPLCAAIERRFQTQTDTLAEVRGIPRARMRTTTATRLPRSIATAFPSATRGRCVHERDRWFEAVSLQRRVTHELCSRRRRKSPKLGWDLFRGAGQGPPERGKRIGPQPQKNQATGSQQDHEDRKGRRIGMKPVEARPAQRRTNADTERKNPKHGPIEFLRNHAARNSGW